MNQTSYKSQFVAEFLGTFFLLAVVVGSGIMGERLSNGSIGLALLANSIATGAGLIVLIMMFDGVSGAHFNPLVSIPEYIYGKISRRSLFVYMSAQFFGAITGVMVANLMFGEAWLSLSHHERSGLALWLSEFIATFGLIAVIKMVGANRKTDIPFAVGLYIAAAYWFTSSTSFANPVVTIARSLTSTFAGIQPGSVPGFILAQILGVICAEFSLNYFFHKKDQK